MKLYIKNLYTLENSFSKQVDKRNVLQSDLLEIITHLDYFILYLHHKALQELLTANQSAWMRPELEKKHLEKIEAIIMEPRMAAQIQADKTCSDFIAWSKTAFYWIVAVLIVLSFFNFGADGTGNQYNGEVYAPMNIG